MFDQKTLEVIVESLDLAISQLTIRIENEPKTRNGKPNTLRAYLLNERNKVWAAYDKVSQQLVGV